MRQSKEVGIHKTTLPLKATKLESHLTLRNRVRNQGKTTKAIKSKKFNLNFDLATNKRNRKNKISVLMSIK